MERQAVTKCPGWVTQYNPLNIEPGSLSTASNLIFRREDIAENRHGYRSAGSVPNTPTQSLVYMKKHLIHNGGTVSYESTTDTYSSYAGNYIAPTGFLMQGSQANQNIYVTTSVGVQVFQDLAGTAARLAGAPRALDLGPTGTVPSGMVVVDSGGYLSTGNQAAYRAVIYRTDLNNNLLLGYPSQRLWVTNTTGSTCSVTMRNYLPSDCVAGDVVRIFRTTQVTGTTDDSAGDDEGLVYSKTLTSANISAGYFDFTDQVIDALVGETIYTGPSVAGIATGNLRPPLASSIALYKNAFMFLGNVSTTMTLYFTLVGAGSLTGKTITLNGVTYNFGATEIISGGGSPQVQVYSSGTAATNIDNTARSLVRVINRYAGNTGVYAYYISNPDDTPGKIMVQARTVGTAAFSIYCSDSAISGMFDPPPPTSAPSSGVSVSSNGTYTNRLYYSKYQEPEHFPGGNYFPVGSANYAILGLVPLRDSLIIIKEEGVFRLIGDSPGTFVVTTLDDTVFCRARNSVAKLANQVIMLSNQGFVAVSDTGVSVISRNIEPDVKTLLTFTNIDSLVYGFACESDREYRAALPFNTSNTANQQTFVYNIFTKAWSTSDVPFTSGIVESSRDKVFFTLPSKSTVYQERRTASDSDYWDPEVDITITSINTTTKTIVFTVSNYTPKEGDIVTQSSTQLNIDTAAQLSATSWQATFADAVPTTWTTAAAQILPAIVVQAVYNPWHAGTPADLKQLVEWTLLTDNTSANNTTSEIELTLRTDLDPDADTVVASNNNVGWGGAWGDLPWGGISNPQKYRILSTQQKSYASFWSNGFNHRKAGERLSVLGSVYHYLNVSEATNR